MERWVGRVALVTGASAGIGAAICTALVENGMNVVGVARRLDKLQDLANSLKDNKGKFIPYKCDITKDEEVYALFDYIRKHLKALHVCINNAGVAVLTSLLEDDPDDWRKMANLNIVALCLCSKLSVALMRDMNINDGHIVNISSQAAFTVLEPPSIHFYTGSKHAVRAITEGLRQELKVIKSGIKVSSVSPGITKTDLGDKVWVNATPAVKDVFSKTSPLKTNDVAAAVIYVLSTPAAVEVNDILLTPT